MAKDKFKITNIDDVTGNMTVEFTVKGAASTQTISNLPLEDDKALKVALNEYGKAYRTGLETEKKTKKPVAPKVTAMVNKAEDINDDADAEQIKS